MRAVAIPTMPSQHPGLTALASLWRGVTAELSKVATLPSTLIALALAAVGPLAITAMTAASASSVGPAGSLPDAGAPSPVEVAFAGIPLGTVGAIILGVVCVSSEYTSNSADAGGGHQITATLTAVPGRVRLLIAKALALAGVIAVTAAVVVPGCVGFAYLKAGQGARSAEVSDVVGRCVGAGLYWVLMGLIAMAITVVTRSGVVPLVIMIANASVVSVSYLLTKLTPLARYLPDMAGVRLFARDYVVASPLDPLTGGLVMGAWAVGLLVVAGVALTRRDA